MRTIEAALFVLACLSALVDIPATLLCF